MSAIVIEDVLARLKAIEISEVFGVPGDCTFPVEDVAGQSWTLPVASSLQGEHIRHRKPPSGPPRPRIRSHPQKDSTS